MATKHTKKHEWRNRKPEFFNREVREGAQRVRTYSLLATVLLPTKHTKDTKAGIEPESPTENAEDTEETNSDD